MGLTLRNISGKFVFGIIEILLGYIFINPSLIMISRREMVLPLLPENAMVVLDRASYHSRITGMLFMLKFNN